MKKRMLQQIMLWIVVLPVFSVGLQADNLTGADIIKTVSDNINQETCKTMVKLTTTSAAGKEKMCAFWSYSTDHGAKTAIIHLAPAELKGRAYLMHNNGEEIWSYSPLHEKARKMVDGARTQPFEQSNFTFEDLTLGRRIITDFISERLDDDSTLGYDCYKLVLTPRKEVSTAYAKLVMWVVKNTSLPLVIEFYDQGNPEVCSKRATMGAFTMMETVLMALTADMQNNLDGSRSKLRITGAYYETPIDSVRLTVEGFSK